MYLACSNSDNYFSRLVDHSDVKAVYHPYSYLFSLQPCFSASGFFTLSFFLFTDPPDLNPNGTSHEKPHQHKSRRGRSRHNNDRNLSSNSYDPSSQYGHFNQSYNPPFSHNNSNYVDHQHPSYQGEDGARRGGRGRGRREGNRGVNGSFGGSNPRWQRPGSDYGPHSGSNRTMGGYHSGAHPMDGPERPNWRRDDSSRNLEQTSEDQDTRAKKPRKFSQEHRRREQNRKENHLKEDNPSAEHQRSDEAKGENHFSENRERSQRSRAGPDPQRDNHQRKHSEVKRRQGPIKAARPSSAEEPGSDRGASGQDHSNHSRPTQAPPSRAGGGSGRTQGQGRGGRRPHHQNHRPGPRNWDKMPESKETQTGQNGSW